MMICENCGAHFDPIACRWRCYACGMKANCCEGAPLPTPKAPEGVVFLNRDDELKYTRKDNSWVVGVDDDCA